MIRAGFKRAGFKRYDTSDSRRRIGFGIFYVFALFVRIAVHSKQRDTSR